MELCSNSGVWCKVKEINSKFYEDVVYCNGEGLSTHANEVLVGKALKDLPRDQIQIATKFGIVKRDENDNVVLNGRHHVDTTVPIEDTMGELKKLVEEGKIKYIGYLRLVLIPSEGHML
ncbi:hypothetical protein P8452_47951 [Trifolium repens]|nr:hypothetical protein P8452_47951 [Trifolium repens]